MVRMALVAACFASFAGMAGAEVKVAKPDALSLSFSGAAPMSREAAWMRVLAIQTWWSAAHTYSGDAGNLSLDPRAGGCWCEVWDGGQVEHGRVVAMMDKNMLRMSAALGPLQALGVSASLTITLSDGADASSTNVSLDYQVVGSSASGLDTIGPIVNGVMQQQFDALIGKTAPK